MYIQVYTIPNLKQKKLAQLGQIKYIPCFPFRTKIFLMGRTGGEQLYFIKKNFIQVKQVKIFVSVAKKWPEEKVQFFFLKIWPKTYTHFYEKQRYNLEWPYMEICIY